MKKFFILISLSLLIIIFMTTSCSSVSQDSYDNTVAQLDLVNTKYTQVKQDNINLQTSLEESSRNIEKLQTQLSNSEQIISSLNEELDYYKSLPQKTSVYVQTGVVSNNPPQRLQNSNRVDFLNYFEKIQGTISGYGFRAFLKAPDGSVIQDLGSIPDRQFSFTPTNSIHEGYYIDFQLTDITKDNQQYAIAWVEFY